MTKLISVIIVNYNGAKYIEECIQSVLNQSYKNIEIVVFDNNSTDQSVEIISKYEDKVKLIKSDINLGFAQGNNVAINNSNGDYIALLNNDAVAQPDWLEKMAKVMDEFEDVGSCGCRIISYYSRTKMDSAGLLITNNGMSRGRGREESIDKYAETEEILLPSGCASLYRRNALNDVGLFDEDFFCYCEDTDLGLRLQLRRWRCIYVADAIVYHRYSQTSGKYSSFKAYLVERNHFWVVIKNYPFSYLILNPIFTFVQYLYLLKSTFEKKGATAELTKAVSKKEIIITLLKAHFDAWKLMKKMFMKRRNIQKRKLITGKNFKSWLRNYGISFEKLFEE